MVIEIKFLNSSPVVGFRWPRHPKTRAFTAFWLPATFRPQNPHAATLLEAERHFGGEDAAATPSPCGLGAFRACPELPKPLIKEYALHHIGFLNTISGMFLS